MSAARFQSGSPDQWTQPRPIHDACSRRHKFGKLQPMDYGEPGLIRRLFGR